MGPQDQNPSKLPKESAAKCQNGVSIGSHHSVSIGEMPKLLGLALLEGGKMLGYKREYVLEKNTCLSMGVKERE